MKEKREKSITIKANKRGYHISHTLNVLRILVIPIYFLLFPFRYYGKRKAPKGACIFVSNHYRAFDVIYPAAMTWECVHYVAKKEIFTIPVVGPLMRKSKSISVNRDGNDVRGLLDCFKCLKNGEKLCIYPEGTRNKTKEEMLPFRHGAAVMAIRCKTPIIPVVMYKKSRLFRCTHILVGEPIELTEYYDKKNSEEELLAIDEFIRCKMIDMKREHTEFLASKKKKKA